MQSSLRLALRQLCIHQKIQDELAASAELNEIPLAFFNLNRLAAHWGKMRCGLVGQHRTNAANTICSPQWCTASRTGSPLMWKVSRAPQSRHNVRIPETSSLISPK